MIKDLWLIGIGTGSPAHVTLEGMQALRDAAVILVPHKGEDKDDLSDLRYDIIKAADSRAKLLRFDYPTRDPDLPYADRVAAWHDEIARRWQSALGDTPIDGPVALLVWGDPSLYDSTLRIAERLSPRPQLRVVPGITAVQALTAAHAIPLNLVNGPIHVTTGRRIREDGWPGTDADATVVVMLDGLCSFQQLMDRDLYIWWGAYLGSEMQITLHGPLAEIAPQIVATRAQARADHGWIMDSYLLRAPSA